VASELVVAMEIMTKCNRGYYLPGHPEDVSLMTIAVIGLCVECDINRAAESPGLESTGVRTDVLD